MRLVKTLQIKPDNYIDILRSLVGIIKGFISYDHQYYIGIFSDDKKRSIKQNAYYWIIIVKQLAEKTGHDKDEIHEYLCRKFLGENKRIVFGEPTMKYISSTSLTTKEFKEFNQMVRKWAYENLGEDIPAPDGLSYEQEMFLNFKKQ